jgi:hypothetical protein
MCIQFRGTRSAHFAYGCTQKCFYALTRIVVSWVSICSQRSAKDQVPIRIEIYHLVNLRAYVNTLRTAAFDPLNESYYWGTVLGLYLTLRRPGT